MKVRIESRQRRITRDIMFAQPGPRFASRAIGRISSCLGFRTAIIARGTTFAYESCPQLGKIMSRLA